MGLVALRNAFGLLTLCCLLFGQVAIAQAGPITFSIESEFLNASPEASLESFESFPVGPTNPVIATAFSLTGTSILNVRNAPFNGQSATDGIVFLEATGNLTFQFNVAVTSFGLNITDFGDGFQNTLSLSVNSQTFQIDSTSTDFERPNGGQLFFGVIDTQSPFTQVSLLQSDGRDGLGIDEVYFSAIPEPSSIALLSIGAIGLFGYGYRRKRKMVA